MNSKKLLRKTSAGLSQMTHTFYKDTVLSGRKVKAFSQLEDINS